MLYVLVGIAGIFGALARYDLGIWIGMHVHTIFPFATLCINMIGCFLLGWLTMHIFKSKNVHPYIASALGTGFVGSFTTFSTFSVETVQLFQQSLYIYAVLYIFCSLFGGLMMSWAGFKIGARLHARSKAHQVQTQEN
ncbi:putative fluoride ion transporter CrcB 1 [Weizmannia acidilactici]|uniref:Fluoride-specific ion channel FluC n=1 Tax=Weizmannia acidilactici TaxID=2607726 RepID=A0A5J4JF02_9BACI|nr:fluoride efflux transporter CrcB [Weizmannia acidilactici]GER66277.1 putative fluoride ion transporter CrcB 1 [Weizmannia acidilactici]GER69087.1 putative fluoride ion transporter CrcB 1 [Weizmannia acidilactici]GER72216.1 putative fluoride ion transporter CrcB 1 [Weizmannia acidilactici]